MILLPAIDIRGGKAVRLRQGDFDQETVYAADPLEAACSFVTAGARFLHVVDLDGAREGEPVNLHHLERIRHELDVPVQFGGGLRSIGATRTSSTRRSPASPPASSWRWTCVAVGSRWPAGRATPR
jgi:phosphoribosylformimino-5-aminoimidazole carboxamide ribonucleotide (ProFAR) isomerase